MENSDLVKELKIRYGKDLYLGYHKSIGYHFFYGYKRIIIELFKSFFYLFKIVKKHNYGNELGIYSTKNQFKALNNARKAQIHDSELIHVNNLSFKSASYRLIVWFIKLLLYPLVFFSNNHKQGVYFFMLPSLMRIYCKQVIKVLVSRGVKKVYISNDHAGDIYIISIILRKIPEIAVSYVQHGSVKKEFPSNFFDEVYVYDKKYAEIYKKLCSKQDVKIYVNKNIEYSKLDDNLPKLDILICLSHQFPIFQIIKYLRLTRYGSKSVGVRFHPSDRFSKLKYFVLFGLHPRLVFCDSNVSYADDFNRSNKILSASSSLLIDAYHNGFSHKLVWVKSFGLSWDYYNLNNKIKTIDKF